MLYEKNKKVLYRARKYGLKTSFSGASRDRLVRYNSILGKMNPTISGGTGFSHNLLPVHAAQ